MAEKNKQGEDIAVLKTNYKSMSDKIDDLKETVNDGFASMKEDFKCFRDECDKKYASKLTEIIVYSMAGLILVTVFGYIITQAINK